MPANEIKSISSIVVNRAIASIRYQTELKEILKNFSDVELEKKLSELCEKLSKENDELVEAVAPKFGIILRDAGVKKEILNEVAPVLKEKILVGWDASEEKEEYIE